jgi:hypothetical protein
MTKLTEQEATSNSGDLKSRKPYATPTFVTYGDVREVTQNVGMTTTVNDPGAPGPLGSNKTS